MPRQAKMDDSLIVAITNLSTHNIGNEAISEEFAALVKSRYESESVRVLGRPAGLEAYTLAEIDRQEDPRLILDRWAAELAETARHSDLPGRSSGRSSVPTGHLVTVHPPTPLTGMRRLRKRISHHVQLRIRRTFGRTGTYRERLMTIASARIVFYSGAGEVRDGDVTVRQLLELRVAQLLGASVRITNQGILVKNEKLGLLLGHVYSKADSITVRGPMSKRRLVECGVDPKRIELALDTGFLSEVVDAEKAEVIRAKEGVQQGTVALSVPFAISDPVEMWGPIVDHLKSLGKKIILVSNQLSRDLPGMNAIGAKYGIKVIRNQYRYREYMALLSGCDFIISGRMHTNIFGIVCSIPVLPVEADTFKLHDLFAMLGDYPVKVTDPTNSGWQQDLIARIDTVEQDSASLRIYMQDQMSRWRSLALTNAG